MCHIFPNHLLIDLNRSQGVHSDVVIKFNPLYDKICVVLTRGLPQKTNITLNFITSLLYTDSEDLSGRKALVVYAQNMLRISGCLTAMANIFTSFMLVSRKSVFLTSIIQCILFAPWSMACTRYTHDPGQLSPPSGTD